MPEATRRLHPAGHREAVEAALEGFVGRHRVTLAGTVPAVGAVLLGASSRGLVSADLVRHPALLLVAVTAMRLPLVAGLLPTLDRRGVVGVGLLALFAYWVEAVAVTTAVPYGAFAYTADLGPTLGGTVPLALPLLYLPLVVDAYLLGVVLLGQRARARPARVAAGVAALLLLDLVLDPGAVAVGFWAYDAGGAYHGVPASNYAGWLLTGTVAVLGVDVALDVAAVGARFEEAPFLLDDLASFVVLWGGVNLATGQWLPVLVAVCLAGAVLVAAGRAGVPSVGRLEGASAR